jgi:hypothetical protein
MNQQIANIATPKNIKSRIILPIILPESTMSILTKALDYQSKDLALYRDAPTAQRMKSVEDAKNVLKTAFQSLLASPHAAHLVHIVLNVVGPDKKAIRVYQECIQGQPGLGEKLIETAKELRFRVPLSSLSLPMQVIIAEQKLKEAVQQTTPIFEAFRLAKKDCKTAIAIAVEEGQTAEQVVDETKKSAYQEKNDTLNFRTLDKIKYWADKAVLSEAARKTAPSQDSLLKA